MNSCAPATAAALQQLPTDLLAVWWRAHDRTLAQVGNREVAERSAWEDVRAQLRVQLELDRHAVVRVALAVKANPPTYDRTVARLGGVLAREFRDLSAPAVQQAIVELAGIGSNDRLSPADRQALSAMVLQELHAELARVGREPTAARSRELAKALGAAYTLGIQEVMRPLGWSVSFQLQDRDALAGLHRSGLFWVGDRYGEALDTKRLLTTVQATMLEQGLGREAAGKALRAAFDHEIERSDLYWSGLAATVATRSRSYGALQGMQDVGVLEYEYVNPLDERTSPVCRELDGQVFTLRGSVELRDRALGAMTPENHKAITPWPKHKDVLDGSGSRLSGAELQAKGIAWPPLHFHCRSSIDVHTFGELEEADPIGNVDLEGSRKPPKPEPEPERAPDKATTTGDGWAARRKAWKAADKACKDAGLPADRYGITEGLRTDTAHALIDTMNAAGRPVPFRDGTRRFLQDVAIPQTAPAVPRAGWQAMLADLEADLPREADVIRRWRRELELLDGRERAYARAMRAAPPEVAEAERDRWARKLPVRWARGRRPKVPTEARKRIETEARALLRTYPPETLAALARDGVEIRDDLSGRAFAWRVDPKRPSAPWGAHMDLTLLDPEALLLPSEIEHSRGTLVHEMAHVMDAHYGTPTAGGRLATGTPWRSRPAMEDAPERWRQTFGAPFDAAARRDAPAVRLPYEQEGKSAYRLEGRWVHAYEGRIYSGARVPTQADRDNAGPVEFIAMAGSYHTENMDSMAYALRRPNPAREFLREVKADRNRWVTAHTLYGDGYRDGWEAMHGGPTLRALHQLAGAEDLPGLKGDGQVLGAALAVSVNSGVDLDDLLGPDGPLGKRLDRPWADHPNAGALRIFLDGLKGAPPGGRGAILETAYKALGVLR